MTTDTGVTGLHKAQEGKIPCYVGNNRIVCQNYDCNRDSQMGINASDLHLADSLFSPQALHSTTTIRRNDSHRGDYTSKSAVLIGDAVYISNLGDADSNAEEKHFKTRSTSI